MSFSTPALIRRAIRRIAGSVPADVLVVSYQKSGRTWLRVMLDDLFVYPRFDHAGADQGLDEPGLRQRMKEFSNSRVVFLYRCPLDTLVSWYFHETNITKKYNGSISEFTRHPRYGIDHILTFNKLWLDEAKRFSGFLPISYEDMRADPVSNLKDILSFMGVRYRTKAIVKRAVAHNSFEKMKAKERSGKLAKRFPGRFANSPENEMAFKVREGKVGGYRVYLNDSDLEYCKRSAERIGWSLRDADLRLAS